MNLAAAGGLVNGGGPGSGRHPGFGGFGDYDNLKKFAEKAKTSNEHTQAAAWHRGMASAMQEENFPYAQRMHDRAAEMHEHAASQSDKVSSQMARTDSATANSLTDSFRKKYR